MAAVRNRARTSLGMSGPMCALAAMILLACCCPGCTAPASPSARLSPSSPQSVAEAYLSAVACGDRESVDELSAIRLPAARMASMRKALFSRDGPFTLESVHLVDLHAAENLDQTQDQAGFVSYALDRFMVRGEHGLQRAGIDAYVDVTRGPRGWLVLDASGSGL